MVTGLEALALMSLGNFLAEHEFPNPSNRESVIGRLSTEFRMIAGDNAKLLFQGMGNYWLRYSKEIEASNSNMCNYGAAYLAFAKSGNEADRTFALEGIFRTMDNLGYIKELMLAAGDNAKDKAALVEHLIKREAYVLALEIAQEWNMPALAANAKNALILEGLKNEAATSELIGRFEGDVPTLELIANHTKFPVQAYVAARKAGNSTLSAVVFAQMISDESPEKVIAAIQQTKLRSDAETYANHLIQTKQLHALAKDTLVAHLTFAPSSF